jgi:hypothetical protein
VIVPTVRALTIGELNFVISDAWPTAVVTVREKADRLKESLADFASVNAVPAGSRDEAELMSLIQGAATLEASVAVRPDDLASMFGPSVLRYRHHP